ncbi:MAG: hypothetical protein HOW73_19265 [Polyangiaceae bacterium]|nr:hypothetical protein [Polyangiaceae bacterium]
MKLAGRRMLLVALLCVPTGCAAGAEIAGKLALETAAALARGGGGSSTPEPCGGKCDAGTACNQNVNMCEPIRETRPAPEGTQTISSDEPLDDSCAGLCLENERCKVVAGADDVECVPIQRE